MSTALEQLKAAKGKLVAAHSALCALETSSLDASTLREMTVEARGAERLLASVVVEITKHTDELASNGRAASACEALLGEGEVSASQARIEAERARTARSLPALGEALANGSVGAEHLDAVTRVARGLSESERSALLERESEVVAAAARMPVDTFDRHMRRQVDRIRDDHGLDRAERQRASSEFRSWTDRDGMGRFRGQLDPERFAVLVGAIERHVTSLAATSPDPMTRDAHLAAMALVDLISHGNGRHGRPHISVVVDAHTALHGPHDDTNCQTVDGADLTPATVDRLACDAEIRRIVLDERSVPIQVGRRHRTATDAQWAAAKAIYATCGWKGCDRPISWCQLHHVVEWEHNGPTDLDNLVPLCSTHHHRVHEGNWTIRLMADRTLGIWRPDGAHWGDARPDRRRPPPPDRHRACGPGGRIDDG